MYYNFVDLRNMPLNVQETVKHIHLILNNSCGKKIEKWIKEILEHADKILVDIMSLDLDDADRTLLFQMAVFKAVTVHLPRWGLPLVMEVWEIKFWRNEYDAERIMREAIAKSLGIPKKNKTWLENKTWLKEITELAFKETETVEKVKKLQNQYKELGIKSQKINAIFGKKGEDIKQDSLATVKEMKNLLEIMERNITGNLTPGDIFELEKYSQDLCENMQKLGDIFAEMM